MRIATWNVNSLRARLDRVIAWLDRQNPDLLCMQETKVHDEAFPRAAFEEKGWRVVEEFVDDAVSGALTSKLVGRARLLAAAEGKFAAVIVRDYDRLSAMTARAPASSTPWRIAASRCGTTPTGAE